MSSGRESLCIIIVISIAFVSIYHWWLINALHLDFYRETAIVRNPDESPNDRNDRGIRTATAWYNAHIALAHPTVRGQPPAVLPKVVLLTDDAANRRLAKEAGMPAASGELFIPIWIPI
jgi:hypothetical protein